jgi:hypothetical protein
MKSLNFFELRLNTMGGFGLIPFTIGVTGAAGAIGVTGVAQAWFVLLMM